MTDFLYKALEEAKVEEKELQAIVSICGRILEQFKDYEAKHNIAVAIIKEHRLHCDKNDCDAENGFKELAHNMEESKEECRLLKSFMEKIKLIIE